MMSRTRPVLLSVSWMVALILAALIGYAAWRREPTPLPQHVIPQLLADEAIGGAVLAIGPIGGPVQLSAWGSAAPDRPMRVHARFRLASLSEPLTAATALALVRSGQLALDDPVPDIGEGVTLRDLLQHAGGWDRAKTFDPISDPTTTRRLGLVDPADCRTIARRMPPSDFTPGSRYAYSNLGYCHIGAMIERATGTPYATAVERLVLAPRGAALRYDGEPTVDHPSHFSRNAFAALGPGGGWTGSALSYWRFASGPTDPMVASRPGYARAGESYYGLGWRVHPDGTLTHFGSIPGIFTLVVRTPTHAAVLLTNGLPRDEDAAAEALTASLLRAIKD